MACLKKGDEVIAQVGECMLGVHRVLGSFPSTSVKIIIIINKPNYLPLEKAIKKQTNKRTRKDH